MKNVLAIFALACGLASAQPVSTIPTGTARRIMKYATAPATCTIGDVYFKTGADAGIKNCTATNTWTAVGGAAVTSGADAPSATTCDAASEVGSLYARTGVAAYNATFYVCENTGAATYAWVLKGATAGSGIAITDSANGQSISADTSILLSNSSAQSMTPLTCVDAAANDTYACFITPVLGAYPTTTGLLYVVLTPNTVNTGAATLNISALGAKPIYKNTDGTDLSDNDLRAGIPILLKWDAGSNSGNGAFFVEGQLGNTQAAAALTFTNKTIDVEGTGNSITTVQKIWLQAVNCTGTTASLNWDTIATLAPTGACTAGTTNTGLIRGLAGFIKTEVDQMQTHFALPADWTGAIDVKIIWETAATTGSVVWQVATVCVADAEVNDAAWNTASTVTDAAKGTTLQTNTALIAGLTATGCAAGELLHLKIFRDPDHASDDLDDTASLIGVEVTTRRAQ